MASPGELVKTVAEAFGVPEPTVFVHDRNLSEAGLRTKGGRGRSAAKMTPLDAAHLLIAVAGSSMVKDTIATVRAYAELPSRSGEVTLYAPDGSRQGEDAPATWLLPGLALPSLQCLSEDHTFADALAGIIAAAADGSLDLELSKDVGVFTSRWIEVSLHGPRPVAGIHISGPGFHELHTYSDLPKDFDALREYSRKPLPKDESGDLQQTRRFSMATLVAIGELLRGQPGKNS